MTCRDFKNEDALRSGSLCEELTRSLSRHELHDKSEKQEVMNTRSPRRDRPLALSDNTRIALVKRFNRGYYVICMKLYRCTVNHS